MYQKFDGCLTWREPTKCAIAVNHGRREPRLPPQGNVGLLFVPLLLKSDLLLGFQVGDSVWYDHEDDWAEATVLKVRIKEKLNSDFLRILPTLVF
jgi:hypothetical protein